MSGPGGVRMHVGDTLVARVAAHRARQVPGVVALRADLAQALLDVMGRSDLAIEFGPARAVNGVTRCSRATDRSEAMSSVPSSAPTDAPRPDGSDGRGWS